MYILVHFICYFEFEKLALVNANQKHCLKLKIISKDWFDIEQK